MELFAFGNDIWVLGHHVYRSRLRACSSGAAYGRAPRYLLGGRFWDVPVCVLATEGLDKCGDFAGVEMATAPHPMHLFLIGNERLRCFAEFIDCRVDLQSCFHLGFKTKCYRSVFSPVRLEFLFHVEQGFAPRSPQACRNSSFFQPRLNIAAILLPVS